MSEIASPVFGGILAVFGVAMGVYRSMKGREAKQWVIYSIIIVGFTAVVFLNPLNIFNNDAEALKTLVAFGIICIVIAFVVDHQQTGRKGRR